MTDIKLEKFKLMIKKKHKKKSTLNIVISSKIYYDFRVLCIKKNIKVKDQIEYLMKQEVQNAKNNPMRRR